MSQDDGVTSLNWFYADADGSGTIPVDGPFALSQIQTWRAEGHFGGRRAEGGVAIIKSFTSPLRSDRCIALSY